MAFEFVPPTRTLDNTDGFTNVPGVRETNRQREVHLIIDRSGDGFRLRVQSSVFPSFDDIWEDDLALSPSSLWGVVQQCRKAWHDAAVFYTRNGVRPLQEQWAFADDEILEEILPQLAEAGAILFRAIFFPPTADKNKYATLRRIGERLRQLSRQQSMWVRVTSDEFYAPWNLLYSEPLNPDYSNVCKEGFWGYQHLIEHVPREGRRGIELAASQPLQVALQLDETIDSTFNVRCNENVLDCLQEYDLSIVPRNYSSLLATALGTVPLEDHVLYFCCHAHIEGDNTAPRIDESYLRLTDQESITTGKLDLWMSDNHFERCPLVFLNACEAAQINSVFYQGFAKAFLSRRAAAVIGPQTEIPAVFAGEFAKRFFAEFFRGGPQRVIGYVLWDLRRTFFDKHHNPLGLLYSVYRGADLFLPWSVARKTATASAVSG